MKVLVVEDEALLAMDLEFILEDVGHQVIASAASLREVEALSDALAPDLALVDMQLAEGSNGLQVATYVMTHWPKAIIVFVTANVKKIPDNFAGVHGVMSKPFSRAGVVTTMHYIEEGIFAPPPATPEPSGFHAFPALAETWN